MVGKPTAARGLKKWLGVADGGAPLLSSSPHRLKVALAGRIGKKMLAARLHDSPPSWRRESECTAAQNHTTPPYLPPFFNSKNGPRAAQEKVQEYVTINSEEILDFRKLIDPQPSWSRRLRRLSCRP